jgi:hypothetical protein
MQYHVCCIFCLDHLLVLAVPEERRRGDHGADGERRLHGAVRGTECRNGELVSHAQSIYYAKEITRLCISGHKRHRGLCAAILCRRSLLPDAQLYRFLLPLRGRDKHAQGVPRQEGVHRDHVQAQVRERAGGTFRFITEGKPAGCAAGRVLCHKYTKNTITKTKRQFAEMSQLDLNWSPARSRIRGISEARIQTEYIKS